MDYIKKVEEFHRTFQHPVLESPEIPSKDRCDLRLELIKEELKELSDAIDESNLVEIADAFCDLQFVLSGSILEFGLKDVFNELFEEVQRSNMSKSCSSVEEANENISSYKERGIDSYYKKVGEKWVIYRKSDNKILKNINYSPADLSKILDK